MTTFSVVEPQDLIRAAQQTPTARSAEIGDEGIRYAYLDKDRDLMPVTVSILDPERLSVVTSLRMPAGHIFSALIAANAWNVRLDAHGTFSYMANVDDTQHVALESHLLIRGGVDSSNLAEWLRNFNDRVNPFEETTASTIQEYGSDEEFLSADQRSSSNGTGWRILGQLIGGYLES